MSVAILDTRNAALLSMDRKRIEPFMGDFKPSCDEAFWAAVHRARTGIETLPIEARRESKRWLAAHGFSSWDDGDL